MHPDAETINVCSGLKLDWKGVFDLNDLYKKTKLWLNYNGYGNEKKSFREALYVEKIKGDEKEIQVEWHAEKNISDYFSCYLTITFLILGLKKVEVVQDGKKLKMNDAEIEIRLSADLVKNREGRWPKNSLIKKIYERFIIKERIEQYTVDLYQKVYSLHDEIKGYLNLLKP